MCPYRETVLQKNYLSSVSVCRALWVFINGCHGWPTCGSAPWQNLDQSALAKGWSVTSVAHVQLPRVSLYKVYFSLNVLFKML